MSRIAFRNLLPIIGLSIGWISCGWERPEAIQEAYSDLPEAIDFNYHVKPILSDKCFACHGPDAANQEADLRLDIEEFALASLKSNSGHYAIVPGKPGKSKLVDRIFSGDKELVMPPPESNLSLSTEEKAILTKWIEQGAEYKPHWSFIPPASPKIPEVENKEWANNEIDHFVGSSLQKSGLPPSEKAAKEILIRRLSFDLTGLPPSLEEIERFVADNSSNAYEKLVDRLLASPAYGERMAADWMDVARYADSDGYLDDKHRDFSPYRDWVIEAFNQNMPYDQFVTWQLAGDLIENPSQESILATAFNRLHKRNSEAGIVFEEYRAEYVADRTNTVGKAILGLSMECARCHDHKYDPISQKEYYEFSAFFNSTNEIGTAVYGPGQVPGPSLLLTSEEQDNILNYIDNELQTGQSRLRELENKSSKDLETWLAGPESNAASIQQGLKKGLQVAYDFDNLRPEANQKVFKSPGLVPQTAPAIIREPDIREGANGVFINDFTTLSLPDKVGWFDQTDPFTVSLSVYPDTLYKEAVLFTHCEDIRLGLKGYSLFLEDNKLNFIMAFSWPSNALQVKSKEPIPVKKWSDISITYDGMGKAAGIGLYVDGKKVPVTVEADHIYKSILFEPDIHTYGFRGFVLGVRDKMKTFLNGGLDELKIYDRALTGLEILHAADPKKARDVIDKPGEGRNNEILQQHFFQTQNAESRQLKSELLQLRKRRAENTTDIPEIMVMGDLPEPRPTYILDRGLYSAPTEEVFPDIPKAVLPYDQDLPQNRLGLAKWLFAPENPLPSRVFVNRIWQMHFGNGLVKTPDDFGNQGSMPTHPELLDWLAINFRESGWDIKKMHKLIVMSATYQQSSKTRPELQEKDPDNELLARGPSFRMTAEMIRDNALAISGLLVPKIGGESTYPYQPEGLWDEISTKSWRYRYQQEPGEGLYRRSLYTIWKRTSGPPSMMIFDVGDRAECKVRRTETSTPLQALVLLNDPQFVEAARVTAEKLISNYPPDNQLVNAFQLSTGRQPDEQELQIIREFHREERERFAKNKAETLAYLSTGSHATDPSLDPVQVAALATVINGIMNTTDGYTIR
ncbi:DUF1553 domain-containing protein [Cyclobacterium plantarum]|uniref:DUF1553 domain-containing protein n=1 Tax=Cyclobacterium plantarum TaxID=2716263 RepID=A0ABX0H9W9_9BACT|nr:DUF1553 domain-containing protein [Cyclobacterium plantarum]NHE57168.1 DUF1553 domain-containing protein [Cyclobacterium plantarum]